MDGYGRGARERRVPHLRCCGDTCVRAFAANWSRIEGPPGSARQVGGDTRFRFCTVFFVAADLLFAGDSLFAAGFCFFFAAGFFAAGFLFAADFFFAAGFALWHRFSNLPAMG